MSRVPRESQRRPLTDEGGSAHRTAESEGPGSAGTHTPESLAYQAGFAQLIAAISRDFIAMPPDQIDRGIRTALQAVAEYAGVDRASLLRFHHDRSLPATTYEWCADPVHSRIEEFQGLPRKALPWALSKVLRRETICVSRLSDLPPEARAEKDLWESVGCKSLLVLPLEAADELLGAFGLDTVRDHREWSDDLIVSIKTLGEVLANALDRKIREEALRESEGKYRSLFEHSGDASFLMSVSLEDGARFVDCNSSTLALFGCTERHQILGKPPEDFSPPTQPDGTPSVEKARRLTEATLAGDLQVFEWEHCRLDGTPFFVEVTLSRVDFKGEALMQAVVRDITARKRAEEEKLALQRQLLHAQKLESLGVLAGGIAHDFNNILMAILGNADMALQALSPHAPARENIEEIEKASRRAAGLAKQMLAYSGKGKFVVEAIDLNEFVREMVNLLEVSISKKAVLRYDFAADLPIFNGDATQVRQVIMNLITNASEALGADGGVIALSTGATHLDRADLGALDTLPEIGFDEPLPEGLYVHLEVADTGCGMHAETIGRIFDPFFTTKFTGRGLGMSAVLGIVRGHKGTIQIDSEAGRGSTFRVLFPALDRPAALKAGEPTEAQEWRGSGTILLVDDEEAILRVVQRLLGEMGFQVLCVNDGREALEVFRARAAEIVCVLLDLTMPELDGEQVFREIRRVQPGANVILSSGYDESEVTERFAGEGPAGFIQKPYRSDSLRAKLREILEG